MLNRKLKCGNNLLLDRLYRLITWTCITWRDNLELRTLVNWVTWPPPPLHSIVMLWPIHVHRSPPWPQFIHTGLLWSSSGASASCVMFLIQQTGWSTAIPWVSCSLLPHLSQTHHEHFAWSIDCKNMWLYILYSLMAPLLHKILDLPPGRFPTNYIELYTISPSSDVVFERGYYFYEVNSNTFSCGSSYYYK